jgi:hypothetical protein
MATEEVTMEIFNNLTFDEKCEILRRYSRYIGAVAYYHYTVKLYAWQKFFIEVYYDTEEDEIVRITMASENELNKHLQEISLADISYLGLSGAS